MKKILNIETTPEKLREILSALRQDKHLSQTFEGSANNGRLEGFYSSLGALNGMVLGYVKIRGNYNLMNGKITLTTIPSYLFLGLTLGLISGSSILFYQHLYIGSGVLLFFLIIFTIIYLIESRSFLKEIKRIHTNQS